MTKSPITNCYNAQEKRYKLETEMVYLYQPDREWTYSHHPHITWFSDRFYAIWSNGRMNEDDLGQRILMSTSANFQNWTEPLPLIDSMVGKHSEVVSTAAGFHRYSGTLSVYFGQYEYKPETLQNGMRIEGDSGHMDTCLRVVTTVDGIHWSEPLDMGIPIIPNHGPQRTKTGRLIISGNIMYPFTDSPTGLKEWKMAGIFPESMNNSIYDDSESFHVVNKMLGRTAGLCEGSFYQTDDGMIHMMLRSNTSKLWVSESTDDGTAWSEPCETDFTDNAAKFHFGRLPDGRYYYVGCPDPEPCCVRNPLVLSLSEEGVQFKTHYILQDETYIQKRKGLYKGGTYGYPHTMVHEGYLYVIYSLMKEGIAVLRVKADSL